MNQLRFVGLAKSFGGTSAICGLSLEFPSSGVAAIIGPNGAGKTTLLNVVTGFLHPDAGKVLLGESDLTGMAPHRIVARGIARTFQEPRIIALLSVLENVMLAHPNQRGERLWRSVTRVGLRSAEQENRRQATGLLELVGLADMADAPAGVLSYGQQKLLALARCLATHAGILFLDEPIAGVHPETAKRILGVLKELAKQGKLIIFIEHDIAAVKRIADRVLVMDDGKFVADGVPKHVLERPEILEAYVG